MCRASSLGPCSRGLSCSPSRRWKDLGGGGTVQVKPGVPLVYLDNAATSQKPKQAVAAKSLHCVVRNLHHSTSRALCWQVLDELNRFYSQDNSAASDKNPRHTAGHRALQCRSKEGTRARERCMHVFWGHNRMPGRLASMRAYRPSRFELASNFQYGHARQECERSTQQQGHPMCEGFVEKLFGDCC